VEESQPRNNNQRRAKLVSGYVYLFRYGASGRHFKIGMSDDVQRRNNQLSKMNPGQVRVVHIIETDDPRGIEAYWHSRFADRRLRDKKEIFALTPEDVAAFKRRKYQ
jgi:hypothetical protein